MRKRWVPLVAGAMLLGVLSGCASSAKPGEHAQHRLPNGDLQEKTASVKTMPKFLNGKDERLQQIYALAGENPELLDWIPCYCGCGESAGHRSNKNCFIKEIDAGGSVTWDDHGTRCNVCLEIAVRSVQWKQQGKSVKEIRTMIDQAYKSGYAKPTNTPMPT